MKKLSTILQLPIMEILNGKEVGQTKDIIINLDTKNIVFVLNESTLTNLYVIKGEEIMGIGKDVVLVKTVQSIQNTQVNTDLSNLLGEYYSIIGLDVITMEGDIEGKVVDIAIDESEKKMVQIELENGQTFDASKIVSISDKYVFTQGSGDIVVSQESASQIDSEQDSPKEEVKEAEGETGYLIGMVLSEDVSNEDGTFIIKRGTMLTRELIDQAKEQGVFTSLIMNAE